MDQTRFHGAQDARHVTIVRARDHDFDLEMAQPGGLCFLGRVNRTRRSSTGKLRACKYWEA